MRTAYLILIYLVYPLIVQFFTRTFNCVDIDGDDYLLENLSVNCKDSSFVFITHLVTIPALFVWGGGLPLLAIYLMRDKSNNDNKTQL